MLKKNKKNDTLSAIFVNIRLIEEDTHGKYLLLKAPSCLLV